MHASQDGISFVHGSICVAFSCEQRAFVLHACRVVFGERRNGGKCTQNLGAKAQDYLSAKNMELWGEMQNDGL